MQQYGHRGNIQMDSRVSPNYSIKNKPQVCGFERILKNIISMFNDWCTIESDPAVFTELINKLGVPSAQVEEVYSMEDDDLITNVKPDIYGFIFLFKWTKNLESKEPLAIYDEDLFFARQIVNNACATQAILSVLLNSPVEVTGPLKQFHDFAKELPSEDRGLVLSNSDEIRKIHNSFSRPEPFIFKEDKKSKKKADVYHFISYVPHKGRLYELDGLQSGPILLGSFQENGQKLDKKAAQEKWIELAKQQIQNRIMKYSEKEIRFNLLVVCENLKNKRVKQNEALSQEKAAILKKLKTLGEQVDEEYLQKYPDCAQSSSNDKGEMNGRLMEISMRQEDNSLFIEEQERKEAHRKEENIRRKHNYVPMIIEMLKTLAKKDMLGEMVKEAQEKKKAKQAQ